MASHREGSPPSRRALARFCAWQFEPVFGGEDRVQCESSSPVRRRSRLPKRAGWRTSQRRLASALTELGHSVWLVLPHYPQMLSRSAASNGVGVEPTGVHIEVPIGARHVSGGVLRARLPGSAVTVLMVDQPGYYDRPGLYQSGGSDFRDNCETVCLFQPRRSRPDPATASASRRDSRQRLADRFDSRSLGDRRARRRTPLRPSGRSSRSTTWRFRGSSGTGTCC